MGELRVLERGGRLRTGRAAWEPASCRRRRAGIGYFLGLGSCLATVLAGCSGGNDRVAVYPVKGTLTVAGEVPEGALIVFYPAQGRGKQEIRPSAKVKQDGSFSLTTYHADDGAPSGEYTGTIQWNKLVKKGQDYVAGPNLVARKYTRRDSSPWKIQVAAGLNQLPPFEIKK